MATIEPNTNDQSAHSRRYVDEQTDKRMHEHMSNEHDEITEEDISNVKTDFNFGSPEDSVEGAGSEDAKNPEMAADPDKKIKDTEDPSAESPWSILDA